MSETPSTGVLEDFKFKKSSAEKNTTKPENPKSSTGAGTPPGG